MQAADVRCSHFLFINVPSVSRFGWHPISVADARPGADGVGQDVLLHLKSYGSWTKVCAPSNLNLSASFSAMHLLHLWRGAAGYTEGLSRCFAVSRKSLSSWRGTERFRCERMAHTARCTSTAPSGPSTTQSSWQPAELEYGAGPLVISMAGCQCF